MTTIERGTATASERELRSIAVEAYVYLYPLVIMEMTRRQMVNTPAGAQPGRGPAGAFWHIREFPPAEFRTVVRPNFDTLYSPAWLDLTGEPMVVSVPDTRGRYYLLPLYDMWTDAFAVPGSRTTGTDAAEFAILPPGWRGELPTGVEPIQAPTPSVWVIGRTQTNGPADYDAVHAVQDGFAITPLSHRGEPTVHLDARIDPAVDTETPPMDQVAAMPGGRFFSLAAELLARHRPHLTDWSMLARIRRVGLRTGEPFRADVLEPVVREALDRAPEAAVALMRSSLATFAPPVDGWTTNTASMGVYGNFYVKRATVALVGLGANPAEDAIYPICVADADGRPLSGAFRYVLHFERDQLPPAQAFWSVTMYDGEGFQVANEIDRFAIGDRDPLVYNADGSLDIVMQHERPAEPRANWLPAPRGPLGLTMRLYAPAPEAVDGRWRPPAVRRLP
jgi:hypothetical protein